VFKSCLEKQTQVSEIFSDCQSKEEKYQRIIELGRETPGLADEDKVEENIVQGCQSTMYLRTRFDGGKVYFDTESDALISSGLAVLLTKVYSGETPEVILKCEPKHLDTMGISSSISPNRANGLYSLHLRMKQEALKCLMANH